MTAAETLAEWKDLKERDESKSPIIGFYGQMVCPNCKRPEYLFGMNEKNTFCGNCGQRLKWEER